MFQMRQYGSMRRKMRSNGFIGRFVSRRYVCHLSWCNYGIRDLGGFVWNMFKEKPGALGSSTPGAVAGVE
jgi:hypothetical protein